MTRYRLRSRPDLTFAYATEAVLYGIALGLDDVSWEAC